MVTFRSVGEFAWPQHPINLGGTAAWAIRQCNTRRNSMRLVPC